MVEPLPEVDDTGLLDESAIAVIDPVAWERAAIDEFVARAAVGMDGQGAGVVPRDAEGQNWTNGLCGTGRGVGRPIRPPMVCTNRADDLPTSGSDWMSGNWTAEKRIAAATLTVVAPTCTLAEVAGADDPPALHLDERPKLVGLAEAVARPEFLEDDRCGPAALRRSA